MSFADLVRQISDYLNNEHKQLILGNMRASIDEMFDMLERQMIDTLILSKEYHLHIFFDANEDTLYCSTYHRKTIDRKGASEMICKPIPQGKDFNISFEKHNKNIIANHITDICNEAISKRFGGLTTKISYQDWLEIHYQITL